MAKISEAHIHFAHKIRNNICLKIPKIELLKLVRGTKLPSLGPLTYMVFS